MTDSNDKLDDDKIEATPTSPDQSQDESELDAKLLEAAQRWAEEFNPNLGNEAAEDFALGAPSAEDDARKKSKKKKSKPEPVFVAEIQADVQDEEESVSDVDTQSELATEDLEDVLAHFDAKARESDASAERVEVSQEAVAEVDIEAVEPEPVLAMKKSKGRPKKDKELITETAVEPEIVTDDRQGLMRWDEAINLEAQVEAILFAAPKPISVSEIAELLGDDDGIEPEHQLIDSITQQLLRLYKERNGGFRLEYDKGAGFQFRTVPAAAPIMERMFSSRQRPLSRAAHETLAIIAYRQPCTRADIEFIRGVDAGSIIKNLLERDLVACVGRKEDSGRPMLFGTTAEFMRVFRIQTLNDLPPLSAFQPASEAIIDAFQKIERPDVDIDVEDFIGDESRQQPEISGELSADFAKSDSEFEVREDGSESSALTQAEVRRSGGIFDNEGFLSDGHENTEVALPTRDSITPGSGEVASRGPDQHQRKSGARAGDEDPT